MKTLIIFNHEPYDSTDVTWNGLRLADKLVELSRESIKADTEHTETIKAMTKVLDSIDRRLA